MKKFKLTTRGVSHVYTIEILQLLTEKIAALISYMVKTVQESSETSNVVFMEQDATDGYPTGG